MEQIIHEAAVDLEWRVNLRGTTLPNCIVLANNHCRALYHTERVLVSAVFATVMPQKWKIITYPRLLLGVGIYAYTSLTKMMFSSMIKSLSIPTGYPKHTEERFIWIIGEICRI